MLRNPLFKVDLKNIVGFIFLDNWFDVVNSGLSQPAVRPSFEVEVRSLVVKGLLKAINVIVKAGVLKLEFREVCSCSL